MDLGIAGKKAIVCGASEGLGFACARALVKEGVEVAVVARREGPLENAANQLRQLAGSLEVCAPEILSVSADITTDEGRDRVIALCPDPDILINNAAGPPPGGFREWRQKEWWDAVNGNMYSAIDMIRRCVDGMVERGFGRIVNITSTAVKSPMPGLGLSNGARAGLTGWVAGIARDHVRNNVTINNLLPGVFDTARGRGYLGYRAQREGVRAEQYFDDFCHATPAGRLGEPQEFGAACAFLCSALSGYISGQNLLLDGGAYSGTF